eukprot:FR735038.1.p1 GENE.FR735038.1~~FR735038.1.p1  ORF type:complete len:151 (+),score=1.67 FR735038.1:28-453(+)
MHGPGPAVAIDKFEVASTAICRAMPLVLDLLNSADYSYLSDALTGVHYLSTRDEAGRVVASFIYDAPIDPPVWEKAATGFIRHLAHNGVSPLELGLIGLSKGVRVECGQDWVHERYHLHDGRVLKYRHIFGHFSNPNAAVC